MYLNTSWGYQCQDHGLIFQLKMYTSNPMQEILDEVYICQMHKNKINTLLSVLFIKLIKIDSKMPLLAG